MFFGRLIVSIPQKNISIRRIRFVEMPRFSIFEIRQRCRDYARQFNYSDSLFNRIPTYIFQYFCSNNPLEVVPGPFDQMDIMNIFMIINGISADLMMAFYAAADPELDDVRMIGSTIIFCECGSYIIKPDQKT